MKKSGQALPQLQGPEQAALPDRHRRARSVAPDPPPRERRHKDDGQHLLAPPDAACEECGRPAGGRMVRRQGKSVCLPCSGLVADLAASGMIEMTPPIVCWLPDGVDRRCPAKPPAATLLNWDSCLEQLTAYPEWFGRGTRGGQHTARHEQALIKDRLAGRPEDGLDREKVGAIVAWREACERSPVLVVCPDWDGWSEFTVELWKGLGPAVVLYFGPCSAGDPRQMVIHHPQISDVGQRTMWAVRDDAPREGETLVEWAARVAAREIEAHQKKARRRGRKAADQARSASEGGL